MQPLLSICIPCFKRLEFLRNTLRSIYYDNDDVDLSKYEVVISDNDPCHEIKNIMHEFPYENIKYINSDCKGFLNSYYVLTYGTGKLLLLHNSQSLFVKGSLKYMLSLIENDILQCPYFFFTNNELNNIIDKTFTNFDDFVYTLSYWSSWSNGFTIWKDDLDSIKINKLNPLFPHTSLFFTQDNHDLFVIDNHKLFTVQRIPHRGGHNKFKAFTIDYPSLIEMAYNNNLISLRTKKHILNQIQCRFLPSLLFNKYIARIETFEMKGYYKNLKMYFPPYSYIITWLIMPCVPILKAFNKIIMFFKCKKI